MRCFSHWNSVSVYFLLFWRWTHREFESFSHGSDDSGNKRPLTIDHIERFITYAWGTEETIEKFSSRIERVVLVKKKKRKIFNVRGDEMNGKKQKLRNIAFDPIFRSVEWTPAGLISTQINTNRVQSCVQRRVIRIGMNWREHSIELIDSICMGMTWIGVFSRISTQSNRLNSTEQCSKWNVQWLNFNLSLKMIESSLKITTLMHCMSAECTGNCWSLWFVWYSVHRLRAVVHLPFATGHLSLNLVLPGNELPWCRKPQKNQLHFGAIVAFQLATCIGHRPIHW